MALNVAGFRGIAPEALVGLADVVDQYQARIGSAVGEVHRILTERDRLHEGDVVGGMLSGVRQALSRVGPELRRRSAVIAAAERVGRGILPRLATMVDAVATLMTTAPFDRASDPRFDRWRDQAELVALVGGAPAAAARFFTAMPPDRAVHLATLYPGIVGGLDGAPPRLRYAANRILIERHLQDLRRRRDELGRDEPDQSTLEQMFDFVVRWAPAPLPWFPIGPFVDRAEGRRAEAVRLDRLIAERTGWLDRQILLFDPEGDGRIAEVFGDLETARHVAVVVPGITNDLVNYDGALRVSATALHRVAASLDPGNVATVAWLGYDTPDGADAALRTAAREGRAPLQSFVVGLDPSGSAHLTVVAHSYGSVVAGMAAARHLEVDELVFVGSPGTTLDTAADADLAEGGRVWAGSADGDPIGLAIDPGTLIGLLPPGSFPPASPDPFGELWHGHNPTDDDFGALVIATEGAHGHSEYFEPGTAALDNLGRIVVGLPPRLVD